MKEFIYYIEISAVIVATITYTWYRSTPNKYFLPYLWFVVLIETFGHIIFQNDIDYHFLTNKLKVVFPNHLIKKNIWLINIYDLVTYNFYLFYFFLILKNDYFRRKIKLFFWFLNIVIVANLLMYGNRFNDTYLINVIIIGSLLILICSIFYFSKVLKSNEIFAFYKTLTFWIIIGTLIFQLGVTPVTIFSSEFNFSHNVYNYILSICNYAMYGSFIIGFIINAYQEKKKLKIDNS